MNFVGLLRMGLVVLLMTTCIAVASASAKTIHSCGTVYLGETVDVSDCISAGDTIGWWVSKSDMKTTSPSMMVTIENPNAFYVNPGYYPGFWYTIDPATGRAVEKAFKIAVPK